MPFIPPSVEASGLLTFLCHGAHIMNTPIWSQTLSFHTVFESYACNNWIQFNCFPKCFDWSYAITMHDGVFSIKFLYSAQDPAAASPPPPLTHGRARWGELLEASWYHGIHSSTQTRLTPRWGTGEVGHHGTFLTRNEMRLSFFTPKNGFLLRVIWP